MRGQGWCRIFTYYQPKLFAFLMVITAGINALSFPILGYHLASLQIVLVKSDDDPNWIEERDQLLLQFFCLILIMGGLGMAEKMMFCVTGENLTYNVRCDLMRGIIFK